MLVFILSCAVVTLLLTVYWIVLTIGQYRIFKRRVEHLQGYTFRQWKCYIRELKKLQAEDRKAEKAGRRIAAKHQAEKDFNAQRASQASGAPGDPLPPTDK